MTAGDGNLFAADLRGTVVRVLFENRESGWAVVHFQAEDGAELTAVGPLAPIFVGESLELAGDWETNSRFGKQFRVRTSLPTSPQSESGTRRYLGSGVVPGIGPELARRLVDRFGTDTLRVLDEEPDRLLIVAGIGPKRLEQIRAAWAEQSAERAARIFLQGHGLGPALADRIVRVWGDATIRRVKADPYELAYEVRGIGFRTADGLALRVGVALDSPQRLRAGLLHTLELAAADGDCYVMRSAAVRRTAKLLEVDAGDALDVAVDELRTAGDVNVEACDDDERVYHPWYFQAEIRVARQLALIGGASGAYDSLEAERVEGCILQVESNRGLELAELQRQALYDALLRRLLVVTGGPGTGKTTLIDTVARCADMLELSVALAAPTGRAAKRMEQATSRPAKTLHRLLEYSFDTGFGRGPENPVDADLLIVDEFSMVDLALMDALVGALRPGSRLLLVGDADQLPSVGAGAVLRDLLATEAIARVRLQTIFRQAEASLIVRNAHRINAGQMLIESEPNADEDPSTDFYLIAEEDADRARELVRHMVTRRIPERFGFDPTADVQVLAPMRRGRCGVARLNAELQDALNPGRKPADPGAPQLRRGDRVMQLRNDYDRDVFNGDIGRVVAVDDEGLTIDFDGRPVGYDRNDHSELALAYATTVHKSQGSEYQAVVIVLLSEHHIMLQRNLLYTALTRARRLAVLVGNPRAIAKAINNDQPAGRATTLAQRLAAAFGSTAC